MFACAPSNLSCAAAVVSDTYRYLTRTELRSDARNASLTGAAPPISHQKPLFCRKIATKNFIVVLLYEISFVQTRKTSSGQPPNLNDVRSRAVTPAAPQTYSCRLPIRPTRARAFDGAYRARADTASHLAPSSLDDATRSRRRSYDTWKATRTGTGATEDVAYPSLISMCSMDQIIDVIMENGLLTSVCTVASFICVRVVHSDFSAVRIGLHFAIGKLYANSFLATLNARAHIKERTTSSREQRHSYRMPTISGWSRKSIRRDQSSRCDHVSSTIVQVNIEKTVVTDGLATTADGDGDIDSIIPAYMAKRASTDTPFADLYSTTT
ncbi:hypothetical protein NM688_g7495 [Phlebia brevispora]|uniref:Uncharacterized protein n=1 Tax=Phlebia brevispora TaxID=194682 RepID=A0ACC1S4U1_9APHY|nr:hypothetical protein NM688_g7495 [Phlebia brevispora]